MEYLTSKKNRLIPNCILVVTNSSDIEIDSNSYNRLLQRNDGVPAYNLAVVVDDAAQGITQVVRGADLLSVTPSQVHLQELLGLPAVEHVHVPLVVDAHGERLAKRHGNDAWVNLRHCAQWGFSGQDVRVALLNSWQQGSNSWAVIAT